MTYTYETRRTGQCERAPELSSGGDVLEVTHSPLIFNQAARIARRFVVSEALARTIAEHAFAARPAR